MRRSCCSCLLLTILLAVNTGSLQGEDQVTGKATGQHTLVTFNAKTVGFVGMQLLEIEGRPIACYGLHKPPHSPTRYTYLMLFNSAANPAKGAGVKGGGKSQINSNGRLQCDLKMTAVLGEREIDVQYKIHADGMKVQSETLTIAGKHYGKERPTVFLVDLSDATAPIETVPVVPAAVPDFSKEDEWPTQIRRAIQELRNKSPEVRKFLENDR